MGWQDDPVVDQAGGPAWASDPVVDPAPTRKVGFVESLKRGASAAVDRFGSKVYFPVVGAATGAGKLFDLVTAAGRLLARPDEAYRARIAPDAGETAARNFLEATGVGGRVTNLIGRAQASEIQPNEETGLVGGVALKGLPGLGEMGPEMVMGMGPAAALTRVPQLIRPSVPGVRAAVRALTPELQSGVAALVPTALPAQERKRVELREAGASPVEAIPSALATGVLTLLQGAAPAAVPSAAKTLLGRVVSRGATGAPLAMATQAGQTGIENEIAKALGLPDLVKDPLDPTTLAISGAMGAGMGQLAGRAERPANWRAARATYPPEPTVEPVVPREPPPPPGGPQVNVGPLGVDPDAAVREVAARLFEADTSKAPPSLRLVPEGTPTPAGREFPPEVRPAPVAPDWELSEPSPPRDTRLTGERVEDAAGRVGETPESVARSFDIAYGQRGPAVEAATQASNLPPLDADSLRLIQEHMGVPPEQTLALGANSQRRLLKAAMDAQAENAARAARGPFAATNIKAQDEGAGPASPASRPNVPGDRPEPEARTFDQQAKAAEEPPNPAAVKRKAAMLEQLDAARKQREAMQNSETFASLRRRRDEGERLSEPEAKLLTRLETQFSKLGQTIFDLEGKIYETEARTEAGSRAASGTSDRPFRTQGTEGATDEQSRMFRQQAEEKASAAQKEALDRLEAEWRERERIRKERGQREEAGRRRAEGEPGERYRDAPRSPNAAKEQDGNFRVDPEGFVMSDQGAPIWFVHQRDAGWWILRTGNKQAPGKVYQIANHPSGEGFTVQVTGDSSPGGGGGRRGGGGAGGGGGGNAEGIRVDQGPNREGGGGGQPRLQQGAVNRGGDIQQAAPRPSAVESPRAVDSGQGGRAPEAPPVAQRPAEQPKPAVEPAPREPAAPDADTLYRRADDLYRASDEAIEAGDRARGLELAKQADAIHIQAKNADRVAAGEPPRAEAPPLPPRAEAPRPEPAAEGERAPTGEQLTKTLAEDHHKVEIDVVTVPNGDYKLELIRLKRNKEDAKQGYGRAAMLDLTAVADRFRKPIHLYASAEIGGPRTQAELESWYRSFGFEPWPREMQEHPESGTYMTREPGATGERAESNREARQVANQPEGAPEDNLRGNQQARGDAGPPESRTGRVEPERPAAAEAAAPAEEVTPEAAHEAAIRSWVKSFRGGIGRDDVGGRLIIDEANRDRTPGSGDVLGRTPHTGDPMWFGRPDQSLSAGAARNAIDKYLAGNRLGVREQRYIDYLREHAETAERDMAQELRADPELQRADIEEVARADEVLPPERIDELVDEHEAGRLDENDAYDELSRRIDDAEKEQTAENRGGGETPEQVEARAGDEANRAAGRDDDLPPGFELEHPTPEQLREREQQRVDAERAGEREGDRAERVRQRELDAAELRQREERVRRERADAAAEDFQLGQEPPRRTVNRDEAAGQRGLLDDEPVGRDGRRESDRAAAKLDSNVAEFDLQVREELDDPGDVLRGAKQWAKDNGVNEGAFRRALNRRWRDDPDPRIQELARRMLSGEDTPPAGPGATLYSGLPLGEMFKWLGRGVERLTGPAGEWKDAALKVRDMAKAVADAFVEQGKHVFGKEPGESPIGRIARTIFYNVHSHIVAFGEAHKSPTIQKIADMIYPTAGKEQSGQSFHEGSESHVAQRQKDLEGIRVELDRLVKAGASDGQIISMVENPRSRQGKAGELAARISKWLKEEEAYQREAGVDIGHVENYFPREYDRSKIVPNRAAFIRDATRAYEKMGLSHDDAKLAADAFWYRRTYGADGTPGGDFGGAGNPLFTRTREFTPEAAKELKDWRTESVSDTLEAYLMRSTRLSEITRRFGYTAKELQAMRDRGVSTVGKEGAWGKWGEFEKQIKNESPELREKDVHELRAMVASAMGFRPPTFGAAIHQGAQILRMWTALATMPKSAFSSISESVAPIFRSNGDLAVAATQLRNVLYENAKSLLSQAAGEGRTAHMQRLFDWAADIGVLVESSVASPMRDRWLGDDVTNKTVAGMTAKFFKLNMLDQLTNWQRALGIDAARVFIRRQSLRAADGGNAAKFYLKELGVPAAKLDEFAAFVRKLGDDLPDASMLGGEMGQLYRNAQVRFSDQSIQRPNAATRPRWANTELGSVVFQLQGFANSYHKNVLLRQKNLMVEGWKGDYTTAERAQLMGGMIPGMMLSAAVAGLVWEVRDRLFNKTPPDRTTRAKIERALSASGALGALDPYFNMIGGLRYQRTPASAASGPAFGAINDVLTTLGNYVMNNSDNTNTQERRAADVAYQWMIEPAATALMAATPVPVRALTQALTVLALPAARQRFVDAVAGPKAKKPQQIRGITEGRAPPKSQMTFQQRLEAERSSRP